MQTESQLKKVVRFPELKQMLGNTSRSSIFRWERDGKFPKHFKLGANSIAWLLSDVEAWIAARAQEVK